MSDIVERVRAYLKRASAASRNYGPVEDVDQAYEALALFVIEEDRDIDQVCREMPLSSDEQTVVKALVAELGAPA